MPSAPPPLLRTERLVLRRWRESDLAPFAHVNADPQVMRHFPRRLTREQSDAMVARIEAQFEDLGHGLWAVERVDTGAFAGFVGLAPMHPGSPGAGGVEVGWRLARSAWGQGFATEAARASVADGIRRLGLAEVWSWTAVLNTASQAVMRRLGMVEHSRTLHPALAADHPLAPHVTFHLDACAWSAREVSRR